MANLFDSKTRFNADISRWNVARVSNRNMNYVFHRARAFMSVFSGWNVARVSTMNSMFDGAAASSRRNGVTGFACSRVG